MKTSDSTIIFGFPGVGKTYACEHAEELGLDLVDSDSSNFHWMDDDEGNHILDENGNKILNPNWPQNYIDYIYLIGHKQEYHPDYIMVATRPEVVKAIIDKKFDNYIIICPSKEMKDEFIERYKTRGSDEKFIKKISDNFDAFVDNISNMAFTAEDTNIFLVQIRPGGKIQNVYDFLKRKINTAFVNFEEEK